MTKRILYVDDSDADVYFARRALQAAAPECEIHYFEYAEAALAFLNTPNRPEVDLLLIDINMPRMTGFEFADAYRDLDQENAEATPLFILSGSINPDDKTLADGHPVITGFIDKPITADAIRAIL
ncbi:MAG: response regulator [Pseudomonadota bacterium]